MSTLIEIWKPVLNYETSHEVSNLGRVRSLDRVACNGRFYTGRILSQKDIRGYMNTTLALNGTISTKQSHRLVMLAFKYVENHADLRVNHIDGDKSNNILTNLEWCTASQNQKHSYAIGLQNQHGENNNCSKLTWDDVDKIRNQYQHLSETQTAKIFNVNRATIGLVRRNETWNE